MGSEAKQAAPEVGYLAFSLALLSWFRCLKSASCAWFRRESPLPLAVLLAL